MAKQLVKSGAKKIILASRRVSELERVEKDCKDILASLNKEKGNTKT